MNIDKKFLIRPRGGSFTMKYKLPKELVGQPNPKTGQPMGKTLHVGLGTSDLREAVRRKNIILGQLAQMQEELRDSNRFSLKRATEMGKRFAKGENVVVTDEGPDPELALDLVREEAEELQERRGPEEAGRWFAIASGEAVPFKVAAERYLSGREGDVSKATLNDVRTEARRFLGWAGDMITMQEVDRGMAYRYAAEYLPTVKTPRAPKGLSRATCQRAVTLLSSIWQWARRAGVIPYDSQNPWHDLPLPKDQRAKDRSKAMAPALVESGSGSDALEGVFTPEQWNKLMKAIPAGDALGDVLRIALATGCRRDEIVRRSANDMTDDGRGFIIPEGKTASARRFIPLLPGTAAHEAVQNRLSPGRDWFPELPVRPSSGARGGALTQKFTRIRRQILGKETDDLLKLHSTRSTWRTIGGRAGVPADLLDWAGGWAQTGSVGSTTYNRGPTREQLVEVAEQVVARFREEGYEVA